MQSFANFAEAEKVLEQYTPSRLSRPAYTTEHVKRFLAYVDNPQNKPLAIHIAGTSGKTSTAYYVAALLKAAGKRVGLLTSPHIEQINERVQIDMEPLPEPTFCSELFIFLDLVEQSGITLSYAELLYAFAFWEFVRQNVEFIVVEVGMGGLLDATNVITRQNKVCIITDIGLDHTNTLGDTLAEITAHKAGIIGLHNAVFCHSQGTEVMNVIRETSRHMQASLHVLNELSPKPATSSLPLFQQRNFSLALAAATHVLGKEFLDDFVQRAARTHIPGRMEILTRGDKTIVLDGAHNAQKLNMLRQSLPDAMQDHKTAALIAFTSSPGRDIAPMLSELAPIVSHLIITAFPRGNPHACRPPEEVAALCDQAGISSYTVVPNPDQALQVLLARPESNLLVAGSLYILGHIRTKLRTTKRTQKL